MVGISHELGLPAKFIGIEGKLDDFGPFDSRECVEATFD